MIYSLSPVRTSGQEEGLRKKEEDSQLDYVGKSRGT